MILDITLTTASIVALISIVISATITIWINKFTKIKNLDDQLDGLLKISIQYPYLENEKFAQSWKSDYDEDDEKYLRYELYCVLLYNYLSRVAKHHKYKNKNIENYIGIKEWVRQHSKYWKNPAKSYENIDIYDKKFIEIINSYLK